MLCYACVCAASSCRARFCRVAGGRGDELETGRRSSCDLLAGCEQLLGQRRLERTVVPHVRSLDRLWIWRRIPRLPRRELRTLSGAWSGLHRSLEPIRLPDLQSGRFANSDRARTERDTTRSAGSGCAGCESNGCRTEPCDRSAITTRQDGRDAFYEFVARALASVLRSANRGERQVRHSGRTTNGFNHEGHEEHEGGIRRVLDSSDRLCPRGLPTLSSGTPRINVL